MGAEYDVEWDPKALKELRKLDGAVRLQFLRKLQERQSNPRVPGDALHGLRDCYKIKLRGAGYRLVYRVEELVAIGLCMIRAEGVGSKFDLKLPMSLNRL
jgi:mRNA interferase RelE/StbE